MKTRKIPNIKIHVEINEGSIDSFKLYLYLTEEEEELVKGRSTGLVDALRNTIKKALDEIILRPYVEKLYGKIKTSLDIKNELEKEAKPQSKTEDKR